MTLDGERRLVLLLSIAELGGRASKAEALNHIEHEQLMTISAADRRLLSNGEEAWRNRLAWIRKNLVMERALLGTLRNCWAITESGYAQLRNLVKVAKTEHLKRITETALRRAWRFLESDPQ